MLKRPFISLFILILLAGCSLPGNQAAEDAAMATRVAEIIAENVPPATQTQMVLPTLAATLPVIVEKTPAPTEVLKSTSTSEPTVGVPVEPTLTPSEGVVATTDTGLPTTAITSLVTATSGPTPTISPTDLRAKLGTPADSDPMNDANKWLWWAGVDEFTSAAWSNGAMAFTGLTTAAGWRLPQAQNSSNMYVEMTVKSGECSGTDGYGLIFRVPVFKTPDQGYLFEVSCDGQYRLWKWDGKAGEKGIATILVNWKANTNINKGSSAVNRLGVWANGNSIKLYVNGVFLEEVTDSSFGTGSFGIFVNAGPTNKYTIQVDEISYWLNPTP